MTGLSQSLEKRVRSAAEGSAFEGGGGASVGSAEGGGEVAVAGEADLEGESCEVFELVEQVEGAGEAQAKLIAVERHAFDLLEDLSEIDG